MSAARPGAVLAPRWEGHRCGADPLRIPAETVCFTVEARGPLILDPPITLCDFVAASLRSGEARMDSRWMQRWRVQSRRPECKARVVTTEATGGPCSRTWPALDSNEPNGSYWESRCGASRVSSGQRRHRKAACRQYRPACVPQGSSSPHNRRRCRGEPRDAPPGIPPNLCGTEIPSPPRLPLVTYLRIVLLRVGIPVKPLARPPGGWARPSVRSALGAGTAIVGRIPVSAGADTHWKPRPWGYRGAGFFSTFDPRRDQLAELSAWSMMSRSRWSRCRSTSTTVPRSPSLISQDGPGALRRPGVLGPGQVGRRGLGSPTVALALR
jgi:hypothetical protein